jgi:low temperature requirement protein LtrA
VTSAAAPGVGRAAVGAGIGADLLRRRDGGGQRVTFVELFFDLVYVLAITQISHHLLEHLDGPGALQTTLLVVAVWWAWLHTAWLTSWFDPASPRVRLLLFGLMLASLLMAAAIPQAFGERGLWFAVAYATMQLGRPIFVVSCLDRSDPLCRTYQRILFWQSLAAAAWIIGGLVGGGVGTTWWIAALAIDMLGPMVGFLTPGLGRARTTDWTIEGHHFAERFQLFIILALGESILIIGATFGDLAVSAATLAAFVAAFAGSLALWWIYFAFSAEVGSEVISTTDDPGRLGRSAYTYFHLPMVAGVIVTAVAQELTIARPTEPGTAAIAAVALGGPALYLAGHLLFKRAVSGRLLRSHLIGIGALAALVPLGLLGPVLATSVAATVVVVAVAAWDTRAYRRLACL